MHMKNKNIILLLVFLLSVGYAMGQNIQVTGTILDEKTSEPLIGVKVLQQGTINGTITNFNGQFSISVPAGAMLEISYVGFMSQTVLVSDTAPINILLVEDTKMLEEIVVVGYGTARKRDVTGSIVSISGDELKTSPSYNPVKSLQGKVPGLMITNSGRAGGSPTVQLRGVATVNAGTQPLYIVDGLFTDNIDFVNPNDISSIEVLKDPSSLAIFGVQGANGVIIITTKRADKDKLSVTYDGYAGTQTLHNRDRVNLTNASEFTTLYNEMLKNMNPAATEWVPDLLGGGTDWQSHIFRSAPITSHSITIGQSNEKASNVLSLGYFLQDGIVKYNSYQRFNARWASDYNIGKYLKIGGNITLSRWDMDPATADVQNAVQAIPTYSPYAPAADHNPENIGSYYTPSPGIQKDVANPVARMEIGKGNQETYGYRTVGNVYGEINFLKDFSFRVTGYGDIGINQDNQFTPRFDVNNATSNSSHKSEFTRFRRQNAEYTKYQVDFLLNYNKVLDVHRINAMAGYTARVMETKSFYASTDTIADGNMWVVPKEFWMLNMGSPDKKYNGDAYDAESFVSYLGRISYSYADKYLATVSFRADASSKFRLGYKWGYFPAVGLGWIISEENFFEPFHKNISYLKLKASWGMLGNDKVGNYLAYPTINPRGQQVVVNGVVYYLPTTNYAVDESLRWEIVQGFDAGIESRMFNDRLALEIGYYTKTTDNLLAWVPGSAGVTVPTVTNAGALNNSGIEFMINWQDKRDDFRYGINVNGSTLKNKVLRLGNNDADIVSGTYHITRVGHSVGALYGYVQEGIFQNQTEINNAPTTSWVTRPGDIRYEDISGDGKINTSDRTFIGNTIPSFVYGFGFNAGYKNVDMIVEFNGVTGNKILNLKKLPSFTQFNYYTSTLDRWHGEGTSNEHPILDNGRGHNFLPSTNLLEDGSYIRVRNIQIGYNMPSVVSGFLGLQRLRVYANAQNPLTFKSNSGYTPEIGGSILSGSIDNGSTYPLPTTYTFGLTANF